jgi:hypothetical protein
MHEPVLDQAERRVNQLNADRTRRAGDGDSDEYIWSVTRLSRLL